MIIKCDTSTYHQKESFNFTCRVYSNGKADISLSFRECPPMEECTGSWTLTEFINKSKPMTVIMQKLPGNGTYDMFSFATQWSSLNREIAVVQPPEDFKPQNIMIKGSANRAGQYNCTACTSGNCTSSLTRIDVMEFKYGFELLASSDNPIERDQFSLVCGMARHRLKNGRITWTWTTFDGKVTPINTENLPPGTVDHT